MYKLLYQILYTPLNSSLEIYHALSLSSFTYKCTHSALFSTALYVLPALPRTLLLQTRLAAQDTLDDQANTVDSVVMNANEDEGKYNGMDAGEQLTAFIQQPKTATTIAMDRRSCSGKTAKKNDMVGDFGEKKMSGGELKENSLTHDIHHTTTLFTLSAKAIINTNNSAFIGKIIDVVTEGDEDCQRRAVTSKSHKDTCGLFRDQVERKTTISTMVDTCLSEEILEVRLEHL